MNNTELKVENFLNSLGIEWNETLGYVRKFNGENLIPCSVNFINNLEQVFYKYKRDRLIVSNDYYWSETSLLKYMKEVGQIFSEEEFNTRGSLS